MEELGQLVVLIFLQIVLGFDNLLYISIESQRAPVEKQAFARKIGIFIALFLRIALLFIMMHLIDALAQPFYIFDWPGVITGACNFSTVIFFVGGAFIMYTAVKEISHMLTIHELHGGVDKKEKADVQKVIGMIVIMNLLFSFDSILSALAISHNFWILSIAILVSGMGMLYLSDLVSNFLQKNRQYEVLGLFILLIVGIVLIGEAGQASAHALDDHALAIHLFGHELIPMSKSTFYFSLVVLILVDIIQSKYQHKLDVERANKSVIHQDSTNKMG